VNLRVLSDAAAVARAAADEIIAASAAAGERFAICLSGGSTPQAMYRLLAGDDRDRVDWARWHVFFGDERRVPPDDPNSNYGNACVALLDRVPIPEGQIHPLTDADQYEGLLRAFFGESPRFDLLMLGMGDDGHTASLFPGSISLREEERWVIAPPDVVKGLARLTLTLPALNAARRALFLVAGKDKADALRRIEAGEELPAGMVRGAEWLVDEAALGANGVWHPEGA
jgi:6-phosphogluconolactonase